jgi:hypothetical protein
VTKSQRPRQVSFGEDCGIIISGSDHGVVYVFDRRSGETLDELRIDCKDWIQTVKVGIAVATAFINVCCSLNKKATEVDGTPTILAAKSRDTSGANPIYVWKKHTNKHNKHPIGTQSLTINYATFLLQLLMFLASMAFIIQNCELGKWWWWRYWWWQITGQYV